MSSSTNTSHLPRNIFVLTVLILVLGLLFRARFPFQAQAQQAVKTASVSSFVAPPSQPRSASDIFLELATTVGQAAPAKRLIDYKLRSDPSSQPRYWAVVDFNQPSRSKRLYVFDTVAKKVESYYVAHGRGSEGAKDDGMPEVFQTGTVQTALRSVSIEPSMSTTVSTAARFASKVSSPQTRTFLPGASSCTPPIMFPNLSSDKPAASADPKAALPSKKPSARPS